MNQKIQEFDTKAFTSLIKGLQSIVLTTHINPDGDALGSEIGFAEWLLSIGKTVHIYNHSQTTENYHFLDQQNAIVAVFDASKHEVIIKNADAFFLLATNYS